MKVFASSDHHFYHRNIIKYANRPFNFEDENCVIDNAKHMITKHNETVQDDDYVLMVGDLSAALRGRQEHFSVILKMLKGKKILIRGNHDYEPDEFYLNAGFIAVVNSIIIDEYYICHYPCSNATWATKQEKLFIDEIKDKNITKIIHGHIHNKDPGTWDYDGYERMNVSVDFEPNGFKPQELKEEKILNYLLNNFK